MKIQKKQKSQKIYIDHSCDIDFNNFMEIYQKKYCKKFLVLVFDTTLSSENP